jgi:predicted amidohydrolase
MKKKIKVAAVQIQIQQNDIEANLKKIEKMIKRIASENPSDLIVFPELCVTGVDLKKLNLAQDNNSRSIKFLKKLALKYDTYLVLGSLTKNIKNRYFNTSLLINNQGKIILEYHKNNLWHSERKYLEAGKDVQIAKTPFGNIGIIICWDLSLPELTRKLAKLGADIVCCPSYWTEEKTDRLSRHIKGSEKIFVNTLCSARAIENEVLFIYANAAGKIDDDASIGQTQICSPLFGTVARIDDNKEGFVTYEYDKQIAKDAEKIFRIRKDLQ